MSSRIAVQRASAGPCPSTPLIRRWLTLALHHAGTAAAGKTAAGEICVRLVEEEEMSELNRRYRSCPGPTDVLAFAAETPAGFEECEEKILGDIVACAPLVRRAAPAGRPADAHWAHILVHGLLHLLGHDHHEQQEAAAMARLETAILDALGFADPHADTADGAG